MDYPIVGGFNKLQSSQIDNEQTINMYVTQDPRAPKGEVLVKLFGTQLIKNLSAGGLPVRTNGVFQARGVMLVVASDTVYRFYNFTSFSKLGNVGTATGYIGWAYNVSYIVFVDGQNGYYYDIAADTLTQISSPGFPSDPIDITFQDGYFIVISRNSNVFRISSLNDPTDWDANDFAIAQFKPGYLTACNVINERLVLMLDYSIEIWVDAGLSDFPFRRENNLLFEFGCISRSSVGIGYDETTSRSILFWLGQDNNGAASFFQTAGTSHQKISTDAIDFLLSNFTNPADCSAITYKENGYLFYEITFNTDNVTLVYNSSQKITPTSRWTTREMVDGGRFIANSHCYFLNRHVIGSNRTDSIYGMSDNYLDYHGEVLRWTRISKIMQTPDYGHVFISKFELDMETGIENEDNTEINPKLWLSVSRDGAAFGNERQEDMGKIGETHKKIYWYGLGSARKFVFKISSDSKVRVFLIGAAIEAEHE